MVPSYLSFKIALTDGQKKKFQNVSGETSAVTLWVKPEQIGPIDERLLTSTRINRMKKAAGEKKGAALKMSKTQIEKKHPSGSIFSTLDGLARP